MAISKKYFAWKYANCNGINPEWIEIDSTEYYRLVTQTERRFTKITDGVDDGYPILVLETTNDKAKEWDKIQQRDKRYKQSQEAKGYKVVSLETITEKEEGLEYNDIIADENVDVALDAENSVLSDDLNYIVTSLNNNEREILDALFYNNPNGLSERRIANQMALPQTTLRRRTAKIAKKIKNELK